MGRKPNQTGNKDVFYSPTDIWQSMDAVTRESVHVIVVVQIFLWRSHCPLLPYSELKSHTQVLSFPAMVTMANPGGMPERRSRPSVRVPLSAKAKGELQPPSLPLSLSQGLSLSIASSASSVFLVVRWGLFPLLLF